MWKRLERDLVLYKGLEPHSLAALQQQLQVYQRRMRSKPTYAEKRFKSILCEVLGISGKKRSNVKELHQQKIFMFNTLTTQKGYIADFYLPKYRLIFEIDGDSHDSRYATAKDQTRTMLIETRRIDICRISNEETRHKDYCVKIIQNAMKGVIRPEHKQKEAPKIELSRANELEMQAEFIKEHGIKKLRPSKYRGKGN